MMSPIERRDYENLERYYRNTRGTLDHTEAIIEDVLRDSDNGKHFAAFIAMRARDRLVALVKFG